MSKGNFFITVCVIGSAVLGLYGPAAVTRADMPTEGLVAYWAFDEGEGIITYDSVGENDGTINGAQWTMGQVAAALTFDGVDDYVEIEPPVLPVGDKSLFAWIKMPPVGQGTGHDPDYDYFIYTGGNSSQQFFFYFDNGVRLRCFHSGSGGFDAHYTVALDDNQWHLVGFTYEGNTLRLYLDGDEVATSTGSDHLPLVDREAIGGIAGDPLERNWTGIIDEVVIYDRSLSIQKVGQLYQTGFGQLAELGIVGPAQVAESFSLSYKAIAHYDNGRTKDVTNLAEWFVDNEDIATIDNDGLLQTGPTSLSRDVTIYAEYTEDDITVAAEKMISVLPICPTGSALNFDGTDDYVEIEPPVLPVGDKSLFTWIKMPPVGQGSGHDPDYDYFIYTGGNSSHQFFFYFDNGVRLRCFHSGNGGFDARYTVALDDDQWHFVGFTYINYTMRLYLDGIEVAKSTGNNHLPLVNREAIGGVGGDPLERNWVGIIDEIRIYERALSIEEIQANMYVKLSGDELGLVAYWNFDEGEGQVALDLSGNGHDGYLGSDWENPDGADPAWVESDAPAGICPPPSIPELIRQNISEAVEIKQRILEDLETALDLEREAEDMLRDLQRSRDFSELSFNQIIRARIKVVWAIIKEMWSQRKINQSKEHLEDSLEIITQEPDLNPAGRPRQRGRSR